MRTHLSRNQWSAARKTQVDGITFDSRAEARRYVELKILQTAGVIRDLKTHPKWDLVVNGVRVGKYTADFSYTQNDALVVEDVKGRVSRDYPLRKNLMLALFGIAIVEPNKKK